MSKTETEASRETGLDLSGEKIVQISLVVKDTEQVAKRFSEIFGVSVSYFAGQDQLGGFQLEIAGIANI